MPNRKHAKENMTVIAPNSEKPLTTLYKEIMDERKVEATTIAQRKLDRYNERQIAIQPLWDEVIRKTDEMMYTVHRAYEPSWGRLLDFLMRLNDALAKQGPLMTSQFIDDYVAPVASMAAGTIGGMAGSLVGGVGSLFGVGEGAEATARKASKFVVGEPNDDLQYFVEMDDDGKLEYWLKRSDGQELTHDEQKAYITEISYWLKGLNYVPGDKYFTYVPAPGSGLPKLTAAIFAGLRDGDDGLAKHFDKIKKELHLEANFDKASEELAHNTPSMAFR